MPSILRTVRADITTLAVDAIVNAANAARSAAVRRAMRS
jgi:O-acetyl-ADP-ribose deacetylase (regulator of RNase III)